MTLPEDDLIEGGNLDTSQLPIARVFSFTIKVTLLIPKRTLSLERD